MRKGFTLIEVVIVVAIIAVIMGILTPVIINQVTKSTTTAYRASAKVCHDAAVMWYTDIYMNRTGLSRTFNKNSGNRDGVYNYNTITNDKSGTSVINDTNEANILKYVGGKNAPKQSEIQIKYLTDSEGRVTDFVVRYTAPNGSYYYYPDAYTPPADLNN